MASTSTLAKQPPNSAASRQPQKAGPASVKSSQAGGVQLPPEELADADTKDQATRKRKPRKLQRAPASQPQPGSVRSTDTQLLNTEIETLKGRIRGLELQVEELYNHATPPPAPAPAPAPSSATPKQPRRRGRGRNGPVPPRSAAELERLEAQLAASEKELAGLRSRAAGKQTVDDDVEEVPRTDSTGDDLQGQQRQVTLAGSYRIPLPATVSMDDVRTIQSGINSANNVVKGIMETRRNQRAATVDSPQTKAVSKPTQDRGQSWSEWIGGYSVAVTRMMNNIEAEAAIESTPPAGRQRKRSTATAKDSSPKTDSPSAGASKSQRPPPRPNNRGSSGRLSQQQVETLLA